MIDFDPSESRLKGKTGQHESKIKVKKNWFFLLQNKKNDIVYVNNNDTI